MKKCSGLLVTALLISATPLFAGIRYEFRETTHTEETSDSTNLVARAVVDGDMSRLDVLAGNRYPPGYYMITHGDQRIYVINPEDKSYMEYAADQRAVNPDRVQISNAKVNFAEVPEPVSQVIAGFPTKHYRLYMSYDITVKMGSIPIKQNVEAVIDKWTTRAFDHLISQYRDNVDDLKTGNPQIDALIDEEASKFAGLALQQRTQIVTRADDKNRSPNNPLPATRKRTKDMVVTKIEEAQVSPNLFAIPVDYRKGESAKAPTTTTQYLTMKPDNQ